MSLAILYKAAWLLVHLIFTVVETVLFYRNHLLRQLRKLSPRSQPQKTPTNHVEYLKLHREYLEKIPQHLAVILGLEEPNFQTLANIIYWSMASEISYISIYDHRDILQSRQAEFREFVLRQRTTPGHVAFASGPDTSDGNGFKRQIKVQILSRADGKQTIGDLARTLSQEVQRGELQVDQIDVEFVNKRLGDLTGRVPDPDVAVYTGSFCCTYGFLPWQSRLTEFIAIGTQEHFALDDFLGVLYQFARKEQRFGK
ncbi:dehydrodolichyl diphosphate synthase complex subunit nus1 [Phlebotomus argentipes]|uniref:dehydrodolichyl diphosphate synthase complex subunit nus1 n=1 Tax=Phlebotomus argentipes TaxID=94469 RepID=UPI002892E075|nr:dehydrodolichyl diphosphate synthase complex subunit nus1 [Phlebotomus argentipes]